MIEYSTPKIAANPAGIDVQLTREQLWQSLMWKVEYPTLFVPPIKDCTVLATFDDGVLREILHRDSVGEELIQERIFIEPMERITFLRMNGTVYGRIINVIESNDDGQLTLRFLFTLALAGKEPGGPEETAYQEEFATGYIRAVNGTLEATREYVRTGINPTLALAKNTSGSVSR